MPDPDLGAVSDVERIMRATNTAATVTSIDGAKESRWRLERERERERERVTGKKKGSREKGEREELKGRRPSVDGRGRGKEGRKVS